MATATARRPIGQASAPAPAKIEDAPPVVPPAEAPKADEAKAEVDKDSADYKAGYDDGYAAGQADAAKSPPVTDPMPPEAGPPAADKPASINEMKAAFPGDSAFAIDCLGDNMTVQAAKAKYADVLAAKLAKANARATKAEAELATETGSPAPVRTAAVGRVALPEDEPAEQDFPSDPKERAKAEWKANTDDCQVNFVNEASYVGYRKAELQKRTARRN